ncbi:hypothetical protein ACF1BN_19110 [Streptomyces sp. NPDC014861]|uniref:hypothetical protein n=1 Tax=Streptomyces sp. NPDC014861 TaxID=3364923 RepID=UPI0036F6936F
MRKTTWKRAGVALTAAGLVAGLAGCNDGDKTGAAAKAGDPTNAAQFIKVAYEKTAAAKSAKVKMTMKMEGMGAESGTADMTGSMGWDPAVMDLTVKGSMLSAGDPEAPEEVRMVMVDGVMYMDMGEKQAAQMDGKRWMKLDLKAAADASGDKALQKQMTGGLDQMNQDPAQQLALLLESPDLKHVGAEKVNGMDTEHYKGTLTVEQMMKAGGSAELLSADERKKFTETVKQLGMTGYDTEVWVNKDGYPARMDVAMKMGKGSMEMRADYSDYGTKAAVQVPPADETVDLFKMLQDAGKALEEGKGSEALQD